MEWFCRIPLARFQAAIEAGIAAAPALSDAAKDRLRALGPGTYNNNFSPHDGGCGCPLSAAGLYFYADPNKRGDACFAEDADESWEFISAFDMHLREAGRVYEVYA